MIFGLTNAQPNPPVPTNVTAQPFSGEHRKITVSWQAASGPWYFNVYRSMSDSLHFARIGQPDRRSFEDHGVISGRTYYYFVKSVNDSGVESGRSNIASATVGSVSGVRGTIRGTIIDDSTALPLRSVRVRFFRQSNMWSEEYDVTDSLGRYEAELDTGRYLIRAEPTFQPNSSQNYRAEWFDNVLEPSAATMVFVGNGTVLTANFGLRRIVVVRNSVINGTVRNEQGQPIMNATVAVMRSIQQMNYLAATTGQTPGLGSEARTLSGIGYSRGVMWNGTTDSQGRFHAEVPENGSYIVAAGKSGFLLQYFDQTTDPTRARIIVAMNDTSGVNFALRARVSSPNSIQGVVMDSTITPVPSRVILFPRPPNGQPPTQVAHSNGDGTYEFTDVPAGTYTILAVPFSNYSFGFYKQGQFGISQWQIADSIVAAGGVSGVTVGVVQIHSNGLVRLSGTSSTSSGQPLPGGRIVVKNLLGEIVGAGVSTGSGGYSIDALPAGQVTMVVDREPYNWEQVAVNIPPNTYYISNINVVLTAAPTSVGNDAAMPAEFALAQNYPNPFNPVTTIHYSLPSDAHVSLRVFDVLGRQVVSLVDEKIKAGEQSLVFNAQNLSSGIYYYNLSAGGFVAVRKMLLLR